MIAPSTSPFKRRTGWKLLAGMLALAAAHRPVPMMTLGVRGGSEEQVCNNDASTQAVKGAVPAVTKTRRASDLIVELQEGVVVDNDDVEASSHELRTLISQRTAQYIHDLQSDDSPKDPRKLLHYLAPKIPAIKHSPDAALRIQAAASDLDCGAAACLIGTLGHVCELYDQVAVPNRATNTGVS